MRPAASQPPPLSARPLTKRQAAALQCMADGMTEYEAARHLGLATASVRMRLAHARERLGARSLTHAVALAVAAGLVRVNEN